MTRYVLVRTVMIANPGDADEFVPVAIRAVERWNRWEGDSHEALVPVHWSSHARPAFNPDGAQPEINRQLVRRSDVVVALFRFRLGTPTSNAESGTVEELKQHVDSGRPAMVYFSAEPTVPRELVDADELSRLDKFKQWCFSKGVMGEFKSATDLEEKLRDDLSGLVRDHPVPVDVKIRHAGNESRERLSAVLNENPTFRFKELARLPKNVTMRCQTFRPAEASLSDPFGWWQPVDDIALRDPTSVPKESIIGAMEHRRDSFKFYLRVPNELRERQALTSLLVNADAVVTGYGSEDEDPEWWRLWFLHPEGFIHPYMARSYLANHSLFDLSGL